MKYTAKQFRKFNKWFDNRKFDYLDKSKRDFMFEAFMAGQKQVKKNDLTKFYEFRQNNSGGSFDVDDDVCKWMFIEATDCKQANKIAQGLGVYFDGCDSGLDCDCCGDRWYEATESDYTDLKSISKSYKTELTTIEDYAKLLVDKYGWSNTEFARVFYLSGERKQVNKEATT